MPKKHVLPSVFRVRISSVHCCNLRACDTNGLSDPYVRGNFDYFRSFRLKKQLRTLDPSWEKFSLTFNYETRFPRKMHLKRFKLKVKDWDAVSRDDLIGKVYVDLATLASGPSKLVLPLKYRGAQSGEIHLNVEMEMVSDVVTIHLSNCKVTNYAARKTKSDLSIGLNTVDARVAKNKIRYTSYDRVGSGETEVRNGWTEMPEVVRENVSLKDLVSDSLLVKLSRKSVLGRSTIARGLLSFNDTSILTGKNNNPLPFTCKLTTSGGTHIADLEGFIEFRGLPRYAQFKSGENCGGEISGVPLLPDLPTPKRYAAHASDMEHSSISVVNALVGGDPKQNVEGNNSKDASIPQHIPQQISQLQQSVRHPAAENQWGTAGAPVSYDESLGASAAVEHSHSQQEIIYEQPAIAVQPAANPAGNFTTMGMVEQSPAHIQNTTQGLIPISHSMNSPFDQSYTPGYIPQPQPMLQQVGLHQTPSSESLRHVYTPVSGAPSQIHTQPTDSYIPQAQGHMLHTPVQQGHNEAYTSTLRSQLPTSAFVSPNQQGWSNPQYQLQQPPFQQPFATNPQGQIRGYGI